MLEAIHKLRNMAIIVPTVYMYYNMYLIKKVYFGCEVFSITPPQEEILKKIYEPVLLRKMGLSENSLERYYMLENYL